MVLQKEQSQLPAETKLSSESETASSEESDAVVEEQPPAVEASA